MCLRKDHQDAVKTLKSIIRYVAYILPNISEYYELELCHCLDRLLFYPYDVIFRLRISGQISLPSVRSGFAGIPS